MQYKVYLSALSLAFTMNFAALPAPALAQNDVPESFSCPIDLRGMGLTLREIYEICKEYERENPGSRGSDRNQYHYFGVPVRHCVGRCDYQDY